MYKCSRFDLPLSEKELDTTCIEIYFLLIVNGHHQGLLKDDKQFD